MSAGNEREPQARLRYLKSYSRSVNCAVVRRTDVASLLRRLEFEHLLSKVSTCFINLSAEEIDRHINQALGQVESFLGFNLGAISKFSGQGSGCEVTHIWTAAGLPPVLQTSFRTDITRRLKFNETINLFLTSEEAGLYSHHAVSTLEFEIKRHLDLNVSFVWDYLQNPPVESSGAVPQRGDFRLNLGIGVKF